MKHLANTIDILLGCGVRRATKYVSPTHVIVAHRITYGGTKPRKDAAAIDIRLKIGKPNYHERDFIKDCIKAGVPFPVRKVQLVHFREKAKKTYRQLRTEAKQKRAAARRARAALQPEAEKFGRTWTAH